MSSNNANFTPMGAGNSGGAGTGPGLGALGRGGMTSQRGGRGGRGGFRGNGRRYKTAPVYAASANTTAEAEKLIREQLQIGVSQSSDDGSVRGGRGGKRKHSAGTSPQAKRVQWTNPFENAGSSAYAEMMTKRRWFGVHANANYQAASELTGRGGKKSKRGGRGGVTGSIPVNMLRQYGASRGALMKAEDESGARPAAAADKR